MKKHKISPIILFSFLLFLVSSCITKDYETIETYYETQYRIEYKTESYQDIETIVNTISGEELLSIREYWHLFPFSTSSGAIPIYYYGYEIPQTIHDKISIKIRYGTLLQNETIDVKVYDFSDIGYIDPPPIPVLFPSDFYQQIQRFYDWWQILNTKVSRAKLLGTKSTWNFTDKDTDELTLELNGAKIVSIFTNGPKYIWNATMTATLVWQDNQYEKKTITKERQVPHQVPYQVEKQRKVQKTKQVPIWELLFNNI